MKNTQMKNQYEEIIDSLMIDEVAGLDTNIKETLLNVATEKKRIGILSILDKDRGLFMKIFKQVRENNVTKTEHIKNLVQMLREYVKVGDVEKKKFGEVMTPISLVNDMLDTLPTEVWSNPNLKWLDPCNGVGIFPSVIVERLMEGLKTYEDDEELRYKHIVENMLYVCELQTKNLFLHLCAFDPKDEYELNVFNGSFLGEEFNQHCKNIWGVEKFDIVVGNPPYQELKEGNKKSQPLWHIFVQKSISILNENMYLCMVHPSGWRNIDGVFRGVFESFMNMDILYLNLNDFNQGKKTFGVGTNYDYYCVRNSFTKELISKVIDTDNLENQLDLKTFSFIPNGDFEFINSLLAKDGEERVNLLHSFSKYEIRNDYVSSTKTDEFKLPCVYSITQKDGVKLFYSNVDKGHFGEKKVIWSNGLGTYPVIDITGEYGLTQFSYALVDTEENLQKISNTMSSDRFLKMMSYIKFTNNKYDYKIIRLFKKQFYQNFI